MSRCAWCTSCASTRPTHPTPTSSCRWVLPAARSPLPSCRLPARRECLAAFPPAAAWPRTPPACLAPRTPQGIFELLNGVYAELEDPAAPHFQLRLSILETVSQVRAAQGRRRVGKHSRRTNMWHGNMASMAPAMWT